jgi:hypothetical protein
MVVPGPRGGKDYVSTGHVDFFAFYGGETPGSFDDEAEGEGGVTMGGSGFVGQD